MPSRFEELAAVQAEARLCRLCVDAGRIPRANPIFAGRATDRVMLIGQAPGALSDQRDIPFGGPAGRVLDEWLTRAGFPPGFLRDGVYLTSVTRCFPGRATSGSGDRPPSGVERRVCRPYLDAELRLVRPALVLLVGRLAIDDVIGDLAGRAALEGLVGRSFESNGVHFLPLPHASGVSRWLNLPANQVLVGRALARLGELREELRLATLMR
jgi:uracil-DNA glycosylase family 4